MAKERKPTVRQPYGRYHHRRVPQEDGLLTHAGPQTPLGQAAASHWRPASKSLPASTVDPPSGPPCCGPVPQAQRYKEATSSVVRMPAVMHRLGHRPRGRGRGTGTSTGK